MYCGIHTNNKGNSHIHTNNKGNSHIHTNNRGKILMVISMTVITMLVYFFSSGDFSCASAWSPLPCVCVSALVVALCVHVSCCMCVCVCVCCACVCYACPSPILTVHSVSPCVYCMHHQQQQQRENTFPILFATKCVTTTSDHLPQTPHHPTNTTSSHKHHILPQTPRPKNTKTLHTPSFAMSSWAWFPAP